MRAASAGNRQGKAAETVSHVVERSSLAGKGRGMLDAWRRAASGELKAVDRRADRLDQFRPGVLDIADGPTTGHIAISGPGRGRGVPMATVPKPARRNVKSALVTATDACHGQAAWSPRSSPHSRDVSHGLRVSEAIGLRRDEVDLEHARLCIRRLKEALLTTRAQRDHPS